MKSVAACLFLLCSILAAACSRPLPIATSTTVGLSPASLHPFQGASIDLLQHALSCEPEGLVGLPEGKCLGTLSAAPQMTEQGCVCENEAYIAVPTNSGHTCVHLYSILETLTGIQREVSKQGITDADSESLLTLDASEDQRLATEYSVLSKDVRKADALIRANAPAHKIERRLKYIIYAIERSASVKQRQGCVPSPKRISRKQLFALYPPIEHQK